MTDERIVLNKRTGLPQTGYTLEAHTWVDGNSMADYDSTTKIGEYSDDGDGTYELDIETTVRAVLILKNASGTAIKIKPSNTNKYLELGGENRPELPPV